MTKQMQQRQSECREVQEGIEGIEFEVEGVACVGGGLRTKSM